MTPVFTPLSDALGIEVTGLDLSKPVDPSIAADLEAVLIEHLVMVIRGQALTPPELLKAIGLLGEIMPQHLKTLRMPEHPEIVALDSRNTKVGGDGKRSGSGNLNNGVWFYKWIPALVMPPP